MKKRNYWKYIVITLVGFIVVFHIGAIIFLQQRMNFELTSRDYYQKGQDYEQEIQAMNRGAFFDWILDINQPNRALLTLKPKEESSLFFPAVDTVTLSLMRLNDSKLDTEVTLNRQEDTSVFSGNHQLKKGRWRLRAIFYQNEKAYLYKAEITIP